jgi:molybdate transport system permease protein|tara:strand:+ start:941 stop:1765 length:825 start_codon:yes stop_codon:yes gene_type:complete
LAALNPVSRIRNQPAGILGGGGAVLYVLFIGLPVLALLVRAAQQSDFLDAVTSDAALTALRLSLITSVISMAVVVLLGTPFAYLLARSDRLWARLMDSLVELPLVLPPVVAGVAMLMAFGRNGLIGSELESIGLTIPFTTTAVVFAQIFVASPFFIRSAKLGFQSVGKDYEDIAQTLGVSPWRTFFRITLPLAAPAMFTGLGLAWARALSEFGATMMFAGNLTGETQTMPLAIMSAMEKSLDGALALSVMLLAGSIMGLVLLGLLTRRRWQGRS